MPSSSQLLVPSAHLTVSLLSPSDTSETSSWSQPGVVTKPFQHRPRMRLPTRPERAPPAEERFVERELAQRREAPVVDLLGFRKRPDMTSTS